jgi:glutathione S-transferase
MEQLRGAKIDKNRLPLLVFEGYSVYQPYAILSFLCRRFQREDLLGTTPQEKVLAHPHRLD